MSEQRILHIRKSIQAALLQEEKEPSLNRFLLIKRPRLHRTITFSQNDPTATLNIFIKRYVIQAPDFIEALEWLTKKSGLYDQVNSLMDVAKNYFLSPEKNEQMPLPFLIEEAYLSYRLIEELNDKILVEFGHAIMPIDLSMANLVIHEIVGEEFANELDLAVQFCIESLFDNKNMRDHEQCKQYLESNSKKNWEAAKDNWTALCNTEDLFSINYQNDGLESVNTFH